MRMGWFATWSVRTHGRTGPNNDTAASSPGTRGFMMASAAHLAAFQLDIASSEALPRLGLITTASTDDGDDQILSQDTMQVLTGVTLIDEFTTISDISQCSSPMAASQALP